MRVCGIFVGAGSHKRLPVVCVPCGNWAYRLEFKFLCKSVELALNRCDVFCRFLLGIPSRSLKVAHRQNIAFYDRMMTVMAIFHQLRIFAG